MKAKPSDTCYAVSHSWQYIAIKIIIEKKWLNILVYKWYIMSKTYY